LSGVLDGCGPPGQHCDVSRDALPRSASRLADRSRELVRRLWPWPRPAGPLPHPGSEQQDGEEPIAFQVLYRELDSPDPLARERAVTMVGALSPPTAVRPLVRAYVHHGDLRLLQALRRYGPMITLTVGRQALDATRSPTERARLLDILGGSGDEAAVPIVRQAVTDLEPLVRASASAALLELGRSEGAESLERQLESADAMERLHALRAAARLDAPAARRVLEDHLGRYLAMGGAVPRQVGVSMPLLIDPESELPAVIGTQVRKGGHRLSIVVGPGVRGLAERQRPAFRAELPGYRLFFTTARHSPPEQFELLLQARQAALDRTGPPVALIGDLPSPRAIHPTPHFLFPAADGGLTVRIVLVGQQEFAVAMEWWYYVDEQSQVPTELDIVSTAHTLGAEDMTEEELTLLGIAGQERREAFARALLAHRTNV
jgi:hypothetical protein